eukprot:s459_g1.t1
MHLVTNCRLAEKDRRTIETQLRLVQLAGVEKNGNFSAFDPFGSRLFNSEALHSMWRNFRPLGAAARIHLRAPAALTVASYVAISEPRKESWSWWNYDVGVISGQETSLLSSLPLKQKAVDPKKAVEVVTETEEAE